MNNLEFPFLLLHLLVFLILIYSLKKWYICHEMLGDTVVTVFLAPLKLPVIQLYLNL